MSITRLWFLGERVTRNVPALSLGVKQRVPILTSPLIRRRVWLQPILDKRNVKVATREGEASMASGGEMRQAVAWVGTVAAGAWLSVKVARWVTDQVAGAGARGSAGNGGPVREVVENVLSKHQAEDTPMVHAFEQALEAEETEATEGATV
jgi:hypothetical protein